MTSVVCSGAKSVWWESLFNCPAPCNHTPPTAGEKTRDITQLLNCYLQVSPTAGAALMEERTPSSTTAICTYTHCVQARKVQALYRTARLSGAYQRARRGAEGVKHRDHRGASWHTSGGEVFTHPFQPWWINVVPCSAPCFWHLSGRLIRLCFSRSY